MSLAGALKSAQNDRSNGGPDTALAGTLHRGVNVALEGTSQSLFQRAIEDGYEKEKKDAFDVALDGAFESAFVGAIEEITEGSSKATSEGVL